MITLLAHLGRKAFVKNEDGAASIETILWLPFFVGVFGLIADTSLMFNAQAALTRTVQDANRAYSIGLFDSPAEAEAYILERVGAAKDDQDTSISTTVTNGIIETTVIVDAGHYQAVGLFDALTGLRMTVTARHLMES